MNKYDTPLQNQQARLRNGIKKTRHPFEKYLHYNNRHFFCNVTAECMPTQVGKLWKAINAYQNRSLLFVTMLPKYSNSVDFVENKRKVLYLIESLQKS